MRIIFTFVIMVLANALKAQIILPGSFQNNAYGYTSAVTKSVYDSSRPKKWFLTTYTGINAGYSFFRHGGASYVAAPMGVQLNRRLSNNLYAFTGVTAAPSYFNFNRAFVTTDLNKIHSRNAFNQPRNFSMYSATTLGLMYINNEKTFSVSGSISVEKSNYPLFYNSQLTPDKQTKMPSSR
ncbi:MAG: hypothetical protein ABIN97_16130 [Ginsengibacter sp.]